MLDVSGCVCAVSMFVLCLYVLFDFPELCFVYVTCLGFVSFWFGYVGFSVFMCVGVFPFTCLFTCCNSVCGACSIWSRVFRICVFSLAFYAFSALMCFLPGSVFYVCVLYTVLVCVVLVMRVASYCKLAF